MKKNLSTEELNEAEAAYAAKIYDDRKAVNAEAQAALKALGSRQVTLRLSHSEIALARQQAAARGLKYQTYIKMLLHQALVGEKARV